MPMTVACGQCFGCRLEYSRQWAIRCIHEAQLYDNNCFITLTYSPEHLPKNGSLVLKDFQDFMKRFRRNYKGIRPIWDEEKQKDFFPIKYYHCGEYGDKNKRPHYHACVFNFDFPDKEEIAVSKGNKLYKSKILSDLWENKGMCAIGELTFDSAAYVARYIMKKRNGPMESVYDVIDEKTGEIVKLEKEYTTMSNGIGKEWFQKYKKDVYPSDEIIINGRKMKPPKYYDGLYELYDPESYKRMKNNRKEKASLFSEHSTPERLAVREKVAKAKISHKIRGYENDSENI